MAKKKIVKKGFYRDYYDNFRDGVIWVILELKRKGLHEKYNYRGKYKRGLFDFGFGDGYVVGHNEVLNYYRELIDKLEKESYGKEKEN